jgi:hypothetical protein
MRYDTPMRRFPLAPFRSLAEAIDTTAPAGRMMMQMAAAFGEFERAMLRERTRPACKVPGNRDGDQGC